MIKYSLLAILTTATTLVARSDFKERLVEFIQSPPPIREMVVECNWYAHAIGKTNTNWIALCWQTNAYILRNSKVRAGLYDTFDTNRDELITVRAGNTYSTVSYYKWRGVHTGQVQGLAGPGVQDRVTPQIRGQEVVVAHALMLGIPVPIGAIAITNGAFTYRGEAMGWTMSAVMKVDSKKIVRGFDLTYEWDRPSPDSGNGGRGSIQYSYGGDFLPAWFPDKVVRDSVIRGKTLTICRLVTHRLELGVVPLAEFYPDRFLPGVTISPPAK